MTTACDKVVIVTKKTALEELIEQFNTREQARFYLEHSGVSFAGYEAAHAAYQAALAQVKAALPAGTRAQWVERAFVPTFTFGPDDLVLTVGPDGLVVNTAKYLDGQPLFAVNPDPARIDGILLPFRAGDAGDALRNALRGEMPSRRITMARVTLNDGQTLHAVNDLFIGRRTHQSARYNLALGGKSEDQSSSGIIVSTGAGSTGWLRAVLAGAAGVMDAPAPACGFPWESEFLRYSVREPFESRVSSAEMVFGRIEAGQCLEVTSQMPQSGVIFGDGVEDDFLEFNSGRIAKVGLSDKRVNLVVA